MCTKESGHIFRPENQISFYFPTARSSMGITKNMHCYLLRYARYKYILCHRGSLPFLTIASFLELNRHLGDSRVFGINQPGAKTSTPNFC